MESGESEAVRSGVIEVGPMGRPPGTVRAYLAVAIVATFLLAHVVGAAVLLRAGALEAALGLLSALALESATVTGFYFGTRQGNG